MTKGLLARAAALAVALLAWLLAAPVVAGPPADAPAPTLRRFALLVGANNGGTDREQLRYAGTDADQVAKVFLELGGVASSDRVVLDDPSVDELEGGFAEVAARMRRARKAGERVQFLFYYSGHSDETGLLLGGVRVDYKRLRKIIAGVPADVRIAILDSCSSGAFTRFKGGRKRTPFLVGSAAKVEGHAYLTSSSADEAAQESDRIGGSFFTHFFVTGLRGAADADGDRRVTLNEAYRFAFDETLARTETSRGGPQHAAYDIQLAGTGDLVMTDLRRTSAMLTVSREVGGRLYVRDRRGTLAAELFKAKGGEAVSLALEPGSYAVTIDDGRRLLRAELQVRSGKTATLDLEGLEELAIEATRLRGDEPQVDARPPPPPGGYAKLPFNIGVSPGAEVNVIRAGQRVHNNISLGVAGTGSAGVSGLQAAVGAVWTQDFAVGVQAAVGAAISRGPMYGMQTAIGLALTRGHLRGLQYASVSVATSRLTGLQAGPLVNYARQLSGLQTGAVNVAGDTRGVQAGLVSVTGGKVEGLQVGVFTYADEADAAIGLIPYTKQGGLWFDLWTSDAALLHVALRFRARKTYSFLTAAIHPIDGENSQAWSVGHGFGGPLVWRRRWSLELDNTVSIVNQGFRAAYSPTLLDTLRLSIAYRPVRHFAIWGGVTGNLLLDFDRSASGEFRPGYAWSSQLASPAEDGIGARIWVGFALGFEF